MDQLAVTESLHYLGEAVSARWAAGIARVEVRLDRDDRKRAYLRLTLDEAKKLRSDLDDVIAERTADE